MVTLFGLLRFDDGPPDDELPETLRRWAAGADPVSTWGGGGCGLGAAAAPGRPGTTAGTLPRWLPERGVAFLAAARLDNGDELRAQLALAPGDDGEVVLGAYLAWGEECPDRLLGDWSLAAWHPREKRLFLARDHHGNTALYFHWDEAKGRCTFASSLTALHAAGVPRRLNEPLLAQRLVSWTPDNGLQTFDLDLQRLPPAHALRLTAGGLRTWRYWRPEEVPELRLPRFDDYAEGLREVLGRAVRTRCRSSAPVGVTLSGGLDSGSVAVLAGRVLAQRGERLAAFTQVPVAEAAALVGPGRFGDETRFARLTAESLANVDHELLSSTGITPVQGLRQTLSVLGRPTHAASNAFWIADLLAAARDRGVGTLLTGQGGNATVSWTGAPALRSVPSAFFHGGWRAGVRHLLPFSTLRALAAWRNRTVDWSHTAIHPDFAQRLDLGGRQARAIGVDRSMPQTWRSPRDKRCAVLQPGSAEVGDLWAEQGAAYGVQVCDPTVDPRVVEYTLSIPDRFFQPRSGLDRRVLRRAMAGLLPDAVRLNPLRGRQAADLAARLHASGAEVEEALDEVSTGLAPDYLNLDAMRAAWRDVRDRPTPLTTHRAGTILLRGLMAGLWLNQRTR